MDITQTNHLSFCAGYGGIDLGLRRVLPSCRTVAYVEIEAFAVANLAAKMESGELDQAPIWTNLKTFNAEPFRGLVDILSGGYPCQPFSASGKRLGENDPRHLWPFLRRAIRVIRPGRVFLENVEGHISLGLSSVISDLEEDCYRTTWGIFSAAEVGASHQRKRVFIYGELADTSNWRGKGNQPVGQTESTNVKPCSNTRRFPARPGEPQFDWEEPRTVAYTKSRKSGQSETRNGGENIRGGSEQELGNTGGTEPDWLSDKERTGLPEVGKSDIRQAEPELGGTTHGSASGVDATTNRVDRLRLLGNGVVPATAAKAWIELSNRFK